MGNLLYIITILLFLLPQYRILMPTDLPAERINEIKKQPIFRNLFGL